MKYTRQVALLAVTSSALCGCGGAKPAAKLEPTVVVVAEHVKQCRAENAKRVAAEVHKRYLPPELLLHRWPGKKQSDKGPQVLSEEALVDLLAEGTPRGVLLVARGGTGKSKLAWSLQAQLCGKLPTVQIDLNWDLAKLAQDDATAAASTVPGGTATTAAGGAKTTKSARAAKSAKPAGSAKSDNPILRLAAEKLGSNGAPPIAYLKQLVGKKRWVLLLDSLDEVPLARRQQTVGYVNAALKTWPTLHALMLTRPPVYTGNYGLDVVDAFAELPQLDCAHTDNAFAKLITDDDERAAMRTFAAKFGLSRKKKSKDGRCYYTHLSTYRDFNVVRKLAASNAAANKSVDQPVSAGISRAELYTFFLSVQLVRDLQVVNVLPKPALAVVDAMLLRHKPEAGDRNTYLTSQDCEAVADLAKPADKDAFCERLLQSSLFESAGRPGYFKLRNQSIYDLMMARWLAAQLNDDATQSCRTIATRAKLLESNEIAGFLAGLPAGQRCLVPLATELCSRGGFAEHNFEQLDQGLPHGPRRKTLIDAAQDKAEKDNDGPSDMCVSALLDRLYK